MKHTKQLVAMMMVGGAVLAGTMTVKAEEVSTNAEIKVNAGELKFAEAPADTAKMNFENFTFDGGQHIQNLVSGKAATIKVGDYRGNNGKWKVEVRDTRAAATTGYENFVTGMEITVNPTGDNQVASAGEKVLNNSMQELFTGGALESVIDLQPTLTVPGTALANQYQTVLEWQLTAVEAGE